MWLIVFGGFHSELLRLRMVMVNLVHDRRVETFARIRFCLFLPRHSREGGKPVLDFIRYFEQLDKLRWTD
ncbi:MAG: hypothetical protein RL497_2080, partial [Pseudomonadota bacterium]